MKFKPGMKLKYLVTRTTETVKAFRPATKDHFGDVRPGVIVFETRDGTCWDIEENFQEIVERKLPCYANVAETN